MELLIAIAIFVGTLLFTGIVYIVVGLVLLSLLVGAVSLVVRVGHSKERGKPSNTIGK